MTKHLSSPHVPQLSFVRARACTRLDPCTRLMHACARCQHGCMHMMQALPHAYERASLALACTHTHEHARTCMHASMHRPIRTARIGFAESNARRIVHACVHAFLNTRARKIKYTHGSKPCLPARHPVWLRPRPGPSRSSPVHACVRAHAPACACAHPNCVRSPRPGVQSPHRHSLQNARTRRSTGLRTCHVHAHSNAVALAYGMWRGAVWCGAGWDLWWERRG